MPHISLDIIIIVISINNTKSFTDPKQVASHAVASKLHALL